jgi:hypothetical protein
MKRLSKAGFILVCALGMGLLLESCASSRSNCDCNDLSKHYKAPKSYKRNIN